MNTIKSNTSEVLSLVRSLKNSFVPINRIPLKTRSLIPDHCIEGGVDQGLIALTHVSHGRRDVFTSRPSLWTTLDLRNAEKTRTHLQHSKSSLLGTVLCEYEGGDEGYYITLTLACALCVHFLSPSSTRTCLGRRTFASTPSLLADITLAVDGKEVTVPQGILQES